MTLYALKINGFTTPMGFRLSSPILSWRVRNSLGTRHILAKVEVAQDAAFHHILWQTEGAEPDAAGVALLLPLSPRTRYYCRVTITSDANECASAQTWFETGKLDEPWRGAWIGVSDGDTHPEFSHSFSLQGEIESARLYICGLGLFEAVLNGKKVGTDRLAPFINDYESHYQVCTYDVTSLLQAENTLRILLGDGWYRGHFGLGSPTHYERPLALRLEMHITYRDGTHQCIATDETWQYRKGFTTLSDIYLGETQDYAAYAQEPVVWKSARRIDAPGELCDRYSPILCDHERLAVKEVLHTPSGEIVLDFGQNFAGHVECTQPIPANTTMTWEFGEVLQGGNFYHDNYRSATSVFTYRSDGKPRTIRPRFTFFGFRYVKVSGLETVDPSAFTGIALYSDMEQTAQLTTGNEKINRLIQNTLWGLKSNFLDMPTDCPQRDERLGWTGDAQIFCGTASYWMDTRAFYDKFLYDLRADQKRNGGAVAIYLPNHLHEFTSGVWGDAATVIPHMLYSYYGSKERLAAHYPLMKAWIEYIHAKDCARGERNLYDFGFQFGDWVALDGATEQSSFGRTDSGYVASMYYYGSTCAVAEAAEVLGLPEAETYRTRAEAIRSAILQEYFTASGRLAVDTQTGYLLAMKFGVYLAKNRVLDGFRARFRQDCRRLKGGFVGATMMNCALAENGLISDAYDLLFYEGFPGWLYAVNLGATTIWERWNSLLPDGTISGTGMNSLNHYSYGAVAEFLFRYSAGLQPAAAGFLRARIAPQPDVRLGHLNFRYESVYGTYVSNWRILPSGGVQFHVEIPFGCEAEVCLPEQEPVVLRAGSYDWTLQTKRDYCRRYRPDTPLETLLADPEAEQILEELLPQFLYETDEADAEAMSKSILDAKTRASIFRMPTENYDLAIERICKLRISLTEN